MRRLLPFLACLCFMAFGWSTARASFDSAGQPTLAKSDPAPSNKPVAKIRYVGQTLVFRAVVAKFFLRNPPPPAKKPIRPRPLTK